MNPRRSKSVKLIPAQRATKKPLEVDVDPRMTSSAANTVYCCVARGRKVIYSYNTSNDPDTESAAALCLEHAPAHHRHYVHTAGTRSFAFLVADDGHTFFAIIDPGVGSAGALQFLERVRDVFRSSSGNSNTLLNRNGDAVVPAVQRLVAALEKMPRAAFVLDDDVAGGSGSEGSATCTTTSSKVPLLGKSGSRKEKKKKSKEKGGVVSSQGDGEHDAATTTRGVRIDMPAEDGGGGGGGMSLERSTSQSRLRGRLQPARSLWMRHVKIIIVVDAVICLLLFAAWLAVCKGFQCVSG